MGRLTDHRLDDYNEPGCQGCSAYCWTMCREEESTESCHRRVIYNKLAAYEDITHDADGNEIVSLERLRELVAAEKDGRLVEMDVAIDKRSCDFCTVDGRHRVCVFSVIRKNKISFSDSIVPVFCPVCGEPMKEGAE